MSGPAVDAVDGALRRVTNGTATVDDSEFLRAFITTILWHAGKRNNARALWELGGTGVAIEKLIEVGESTVATWRELEA